MDKQWGCDLALTLDELVVVLHAMEDNKAPRMDVFPYELYKATWDFLGHDLLCVY
jgi:hypothetical protein